MPKIYGSVNLVGSILKCNNCGLEFKSDKQLNKIIYGKRATCPLCSITRGRDIRLPFDKEGHIYINTLETYKSLANGYITFRCNVCNSNFTVAATYMKEWLDKPRCTICNKNKNAKAVVNVNTNYANTKAKHVENVQSAKEPELDISSKPITKNSQDSDQTSKSEGFSKYVGRIFNKSFKISYADRNRVSMQCISCGLNLEDRSPKAIKIMLARNTLSCPRCKDLYGNTDIVDKITAKYLGKIYNGLIITNIYCDDHKITYCDLGCLNSKIIGKDGEIAYKHYLTKKDFASVVNHEVTCPSCGQQSVLNNYYYKSVLYKKCPNFVTNVERARDGVYIGPQHMELFGTPEFDNLDASLRKAILNSKAKRLSLNDFMTKDEHICKYCALDNCKDRNSSDKKFSNIMNEVDFESNVRECINNVTAEFPTIYSTTDKTSNSYKEYREKGIIRFRKAYTGRNGENYYFCKCINHETEMILSSSEIEEFNHKECNGEFKQSNSFFNIDEVYLPIPNKK